MSLRQKTVDLLEGPYWFGYWVGRYQACRDDYLFKARHYYKESKAMRQLYVQYARQNNWMLVRSIKSLVAARQEKKAWS